MKYKKIIIFVLGLGLLTACGALENIQRSCKTEITKTANGNFIFCALCDSLTFKKVFTNDTTRNR